MTDKPIDDRVFRAPKEYEGKLYVAVYAVPQGEGQWAYQLVVRDSYEEMFRETDARVQEGRDKCVGAFSCVNINFWNAAEKKARALTEESKQTPLFIQPLTLQDIVGKA